MSDEIYFEIPVKLGKENSQREVKVGDVAYWSLGNAFCIFSDTHLPARQMNLRLIVRLTCLEKSSETQACLKG